MVTNYCLVKCNGTAAVKCRCDLNLNITAHKTTQNLLQSHFDENQASHFNKITFSGINHLANANLSPQGYSLRSHF